MTTKTDNAATPAMVQRNSVIDKNMLGLVGHYCDGVVFILSKVIRGDLVMSILSLIAASTPYHASDV